MANDISGFGLKIWVKASVSFPQGFPVTQFADDADPFDMPSIVIAETGMGLNGDLVKWSKATPLTAVLNVIPNSEDDANLSELYNANRVGKGKSGARDVITMTVAYPDGRTYTLSGGIITEGIAGLPVASAGRLKSKNYGFTFEGISNSAA